MRVSGGLDRVDARRVRRACAVLACAVLLAACGGGSAASGRPDAISAVAQFYPLQFVLQEVGGDDVDVSNITPAGAEPHDLELTPQDMTTLIDAALVVYLSGFAPALDDAVADLDDGQVVDAADAARLDLESADHHADHDDDHDDGHDDGHGGVDPHFWLDPLRLADVADALAERLGEVDPDGARGYTERAAELRTELEALDAEFTEGLAECDSRELVTSHAAFGYLAERYDLTQVGIAGLSPNDDPSTAQLAEVADFVTEHGVQTIYYETLVDPAIAETVAAETGAVTAVLDPLEGLTDESPGSDYFEVMRSNLGVLRAGQVCG